MARIPGGGLPRTPIAIVENPVLPERPVGDDLIVWSASAGNSVVITAKNIGPKELVVGYQLATIPPLVFPVGTPDPWIAEVTLAPGEQQQVPTQFQEVPKGEWGLDIIINGGLATGGDVFQNVFTYDIP